MPKVYILLNRGERQTKKDENGNLKHEPTNGWMKEVSESLKNNPDLEIKSIGSPGFHTRSSSQEDLQKLEKIEEIQAITKLAKLPEQYYKAKESKKKLIAESIIKGIINEAIIAIDGNKNDFIPLPSNEDYYIVFYENIANNLLWPLFHSFLGFEKFFFDAQGNFSFPETVEAEFEIYQEKNHQAAKKFIDETINDKEPPVFWVHDYHFLLVPEMVRKMRSNQPIGYFHHIPFPPLEIMQLFPRKYLEKIIDGMLGADYIGFHTENYKKNFIDCVKAIRPDQVKETGDYLEYQGRKIKVDVNPIGIDYEKHSNFTTNQNILDKLNELRTDKDHQLILSMSRLDPPKGILEVIDAIDRLLDEDSTLKRKFTLVLQVIPSREGVPAYSELNDAIHKRINTFKEKYKENNPIHFINRGLSFDQIKTLQAEADICVVPTQCDGFNLVTAETIAAHEDRKPFCLILSKGTGISQNLPEGPLFVSDILKGKNLPITEKTRNSFVEEIKEQLKIALKMSHEEKKNRTKQLQTTIKEYKLADWAKRCIDLTIETSNLSRKNGNNIKIKNGKKKKKLNYLFSEFSSPEKNLKETITKETTSLKPR